jgi:acetyl esterase
MSKARGGTPAEIARTEARAEHGPAGDIPLRIYWPKSAPPHGAVIYFHGGGHVIGDLDTHDTIARNLCAGAGAVLVSVDYRLGPEHKFPAAVDDAWAAYEWVRRQAASLGVDATRLAVCGDSSGGNLAAVVALMARDAGRRDIKLQALIYPVADYSLVGESYEQFTDGYGILTRNAMQWFRGHYLGSRTEAEDWRASPIKAKSFAGLPPALIITAECDVLRDDGHRLAAALRAGGTPVEHKEYAGMIHGFFAMTPAIDDAVNAQHHVAEALKRALS